MMYNKQIHQVIIISLFAYIKFQVKKHITHLKH